VSEARHETVRVALLGLLRERPMTSEELAAAYRELNADHALPTQSPRAIVNRVIELSETGRIRPRWEAR
jgi:hypothetical protein